MMTEQNPVAKVTKRDVTKVWFIYYLGAELSNSYERLQSLIFCASMIPVLKKLYTTKEALSEALQRHLNFFNTEGIVGSIIHGITIAMEEQKAKEEDVPDAAITGIKTGLMGPLAGIGDAVVWGAIMPLIIAVFLPLAMNGNPMGGIMPLVAYTGVTLAISYMLCHKGYTLGKESIIGLLQDGRIKELITGASVLGLFMMGALSASYIKIATPLKISLLEGSPIVIQEVLDSMAPGLLPLLAVFGIYAYLKHKGPRYNRILVTIILISVVCSLLGIL
ncbi:D-glucosaminate-specific PTS system IID component [Sporomusaceae bacterium BoRhaA]|uniref:PTS system mannose/fructose/sorbose family transporter subunit IID n=1 Tax=Pelorhabdus rhamnosifermentans TaxID=2772457 RepID=UPI001C06067E|nr:PTS system mannose/fructose/sorbose family transporter subunit IID [Pelorhabdus rhamnosifermentans]MBU2702737.1 D-glucosaminate-specific PTS system IID component [Pelorhabdus rhamnosifermentans]